MSILDKLFKSKATPATAARVPESNEFSRLFASATSAATSRDYERAIQLYDQAIAANPSSAEAYYKRANAQKDLGRLEEAVHSYSEAIRRKPDYAYAYCNRGYVQHRLGQLAESLSSYDNAITLGPTDALAHYNRALLLQDCSRWEEALASYAQAIAINPEFPEARYNRALTLLLVGKFHDGWQAFEWRWNNAQRLGIGELRQFEQPLWLGETSLAGKRLLIHSEQGLGDALQFCRYATLSAILGATVIMEAQEPLLGLLSSLEGVSELIPKGQRVPAFDYHCPLMSLPLAFKTTLDTIPAPPKYLRSDSGKIAQWRNRLGEARRPRIGLTWSGNPNNPVDARRSIALADWIAHLPSEFEYFRLQTQLRPADRVTMDSTDCIFSFEDFDNGALDFSGTAALCECMDLVITVDTSLAHCSGALGRPTWVLLPFLPDWRWLLDRADSPWYPTMRLYRQKRPGDWAEVLSRVATDLRREFMQGRSPSPVT
jgi:tetratricopeptide (TPR) repeat protein